MNQLKNTLVEGQGLVHNPQGQSSVVLVCEHASYFIPSEYQSLGLADDALKSHAAWDPGAMAVAQRLSRHLDAALVVSDVSRLVYDCNRPPAAADAMPSLSEKISIPGNLNLTPEQQSSRVRLHYEPFRDSLAQTLASKAHPVLVTVHSFTPVYYGKIRAVEIGILHDADTRLADAMLNLADAHTTGNVQRNEPYGPEHGVTHTLKAHAVPVGHLNVMLEIRNDLIETEQQQDAIACCIADWVSDAIGKLQVPEHTSCQA
jgi:predicted N-formylglutamate amidohydrolase